MRTRTPGLTFLVALLVVAACRAPEPQQAWLGQPEVVAPGVELYHATDPTLVEPAGVVSAYLLRLNPALVRLESALANGVILGAEPVEAIAGRNRAVAAVNGGFFNAVSGRGHGAGRGRV